ncbi:MAG: TetR/AcrR family transcriptional regulator [Bdellovibrionota bacterium]
MGRPKQFERCEVTNKALQVFWQKGFLDTSLKDLEEATGVFKPALYSEFGDKVGLFLECMRYYRENYAKERLLKRDPPGWSNIEAFLKPDIFKNCEKSCFDIDVFSRDLPILERELGKPMGNGIDHIPPMIKTNLEAAGVAHDKLDTLTSTIFIFYCGLSVVAKAQTNEQLTNLAMEFLDSVR